MKKLIAIILILALLIPSFAFAVKDNDFIGTWVNVIGDDTKYITVIVLTSNYICYCSVTTINPDGSAGFSRTHVGKWYTKATTYGTRIHMETGENTSMNAKLYGDFLAIISDYSDDIIDYYGKVAERFW